jgi:hypothetical protein
VQGAGIFNQGEAWLKNVTIAANRAHFGFGVDNDNSSGGNFHFANTIIAGNGADGLNNCAGTLISHGGNLVGDKCNIMGGPVPPGAPGDQTRVNPWDVFVMNPEEVPGEVPRTRLPLLADNGGPTYTHALCTRAQVDKFGNPHCLNGSRAINKAWQGMPGQHPFACERDDQRGFPRDSATTRDGSGCDVGAFERQPSDQ